ADERAWIEAQVEGGAFKTTLSADEKKAVLERLTRIENFEKFIHKTFVGQKRFSGEGLDTQIILLDEIIKLSESKGVKNVRIGMSYRGRLFVSSHVLHLPYEMMFSSFAFVSNDLFFPEDGKL